MELILTFAYALIVFSLAAGVAGGIALLRLRYLDKKRRTALQEADTWIGEVEPEAQELLQNQIGD